MINKHIRNVNFAIFDEGNLIEIVEPDHIGLIGIHTKTINNNYPKNKVLEIGVIGPDKVCKDEHRVPVIVSLSNSDGLGLRLKDFDGEKVKRWSKILDELSLS